LVNTATAKAHGSIAYTVDDIVVTIDENDSDNGLFLYPNRVTDVLYIKASAVWSAEIYCMQDTQLVVVTDDVKSINMSGLASGSLHGGSLYDRGQNVS